MTLVGHRPTTRDLDLAPSKFFWVQEKELFEVVVDDVDDGLGSATRCLLSSMQAVSTERARGSLYGVKMEQEGDSKNVGAVPKFHLCTCV